MSGKKFFKQQFQLRSFLLTHDVTSDFYLSCFQRNRSTIPLLMIRMVIFAGCLGTWIASMVLMVSIMPTKYWPLYLTHWGLVFNTIAAGFALLVSILAVFKPLDKNSGLPWYVQVYWATFNVSAPIAFFITVFYWSLLSELAQDFAFDFTLDVFIHGINSVLMFALLVTSRCPTNFLHVYFPISTGIIYLVFTYVYYALGGIDAFGQHAIYPMLDWENPGQTVGLAALCTVGFAVIHAVIVGLTAARDALSRRCRKDATAYDIQETY